MTQIAFSGSQAFSKTKIRCEKKVFRAARCWYLKQHLGTDNRLDSIMSYAHYGVIVDLEVRTGVSKHFDSRTTMGSKI